jgi:DnaK suppressor protein
MTTQTDDRRTALLEHRERLQVEYDQLDSELQAVDQATDEGDVYFDEDGGEGSPAAVERDRLRALLASARGSLRDIDAALRRLDDGSYGTCTTCGRAIAPERLEAMPTTTQCVTCKAAGPLTRRR